jgi:hypothetical protein
MTIHDVRRFGPVLREAEQLYDDALGDLDAARLARGDAIGLGASLRGADETEVHDLSVDHPKRKLRRNFGYRFAYLRSFARRGLVAANSRVSLMMSTGCSPAAERAGRHEYDHHHAGLR